MGSALLYPNIHLRDLATTKSALLFWDTLYRIVPESVSPVDHPDIVEIIHSSNCIKDLRPGPYVEATAARFKSRLPHWAERAAALDPDFRRIEALTTLRPEKVYDSLLSTLRSEGLLNEGSDGWLSGPRDLIGEYMVYLASEVATQNKLAMITTNPPAWTSQGFFGMDGSWGSVDTGVPAGMIALLLLRDFVPTNIERISPRALLDWRDDHRDSRHNFASILRDDAIALSGIRDPGVLEDAITSMKEELERLTQQFKKDSAELKVAGFFGTSALVTPIPIEIANHLPHLSPELHATILGAGLFLACVGSVSRTKHSLARLASQSPASYLVELQKLPTEESARRYASRLRYGIHEFMED